MGDRHLLGAADVTDDVLLAMVSDLLDQAVASLHDVHVEEFEYDLPAITTAGRHRVFGVASCTDGDQPFSMFVKQVQEWSRSPYFADVPPDFREQAARMVPWRTEAEVYRSDLADRLPDGLGMPRALGVYDLDEQVVRRCGSRSPGGGAEPVGRRAVPSVPPTWSDGSPAAQP